VIAWCEQHKNDPASANDDDDNRRKTTDIDEWDQKFMQVDQEMLFEIILVRLRLHHCYYDSTVWTCTDCHRLPTTSTSRPSSTLAARPSPT
jgi:hypothetical protein